jgi:hypothetical protein
VKLICRRDQGDVLALVEADAQDRRNWKISIHEAHKRHTLGSRSNHGDDIMVGDSRVGRGAI